jgi:hypothetical protein
LIIAVRRAKARRTAMINSSGAKAGKRMIAERDVNGVEER